MTITKENLISRIYKALEIMQKTREFCQQVSVSFPKTGDFDKLACEELQTALFEIENDEIRFANQRISEVETYHLYPHHDYIPMNPELIQYENYDVSKEIRKLKETLTLFIK